MGKSVLNEAVVARLMKAGMSEKKAIETAKALNRTLHKDTKPSTIQEKLVDAVGMSKRKATEYAGIISATAKRALKKEKASKTLADTALAPSVEKMGLRLDMPVVDVRSAKGAEVLQRMNGLTSGVTYIVAAVKGDNGAVAVRRLSSDLYKIKFYPDMEHWNLDFGSLNAMGATSHLHRTIYDRFFVTESALETVLGRVASMNKPKSRVKSILDRLFGITFEPLKEAFNQLHGSYANTQHQSVASM